METQWKLSALLLTVLLFGALQSVSSEDNTAAVVEKENLCLIVTKNTNHDGAASLCQRMSSTSIFSSRTLLDSDPALEILRQFQEIINSTFVFIDLTSSSSSKLCFIQDAQDLKQLPFTKCLGSDLPVVCLSSCSNTPGWSKALGDGEFPVLFPLSKQKHLPNGTDSSLNKLGLRKIRSPMFGGSRGSLHYNPADLLAGDSREFDDYQSYEDDDSNSDEARLLDGDYDYQSYEYDGANLVDETRHLDKNYDITTIYNAEHDLNAMTIGRNSNNINLDEAVGILDEVLRLDRQTLLRQRTSVMNIIHSFDKAVDMTPVKEDSTVLSQSPRVAVLISDTRGMKYVSGLLLSSSGIMSDILHVNYLKELTDDISVNQLANRTDIDGAVVLPQSLRTKTRAGFTVFAKDTLFHPVTNSTHQVNSRVISLSVNSEQYYNNVPDKEYVYIIFKPKSTDSKNRLCMFWDFSSGGHWSNSGCELIETSESGLDICRCNHATHFAEIITDADVDSNNSAVLDIISIVGCSLSLLGVLGIAFTAVLFKQWRAELGNKFLLHLASAIALNMSMFLAVAIGGSTHSDIACIALGALLHYSMLASFCWMLVSAVLQFLRLVIVFSSRGSHILLKCAIFAWGAPLAPVVILLIIDPHLYTKEGRNFCYPQGLPFYTAVMGPIALIVLNNLIAYVVILYNIYPCCRNSRDKSFIRNKIQDRSYTLRCFWLSILLFFLFGLTWIFGFLARTKLFAYLFCTCASLQGFVLFIFFIAGEKKVRKQWTQKTHSWAWTDTVPRGTRSTYIPGSDGTSGNTAPRTTISSDGRVETSFDF
ncbi:adhesion G-protein coupled receptor G6 [Anabrus simplex]|uniref:adhesion G-protein coupled receptor G6 n=1 Tax=Anabrus simplex TaxID=316456 RepID=UPI0035A28A8D